MKYIIQEIYVVRDKNKNILTCALKESLALKQALQLFNVTAMVLASMGFRCEKEPWKVPSPESI